MNNDNNNSNNIQKTNVGSIDKLLLNGTHEEIQKNLLVEIYKIATYCETLIGEGYYGRVTLQSIGPQITIKIDDENVQIPVVVKEAKHLRNPPKFRMDVVESDLILSCGEGMTCEAIILYILSKAWYKEKNIHMPLLVGMGSCDDYNIGISHLVLEKYGLENRINIKKHKFFGSPATLVFEQQDTIESFLTNVGGLIDYISFSLNDKMMCKLPNNITVYLPELIDNMCIFYLHTSYFLWNNYKLTLGDQSTNNVFIYWINENSRCGKKKLDKLKFINYNIGPNKYIRTNANKIIFKIGDIGISIMTPQPNVMIVGNLSDPDNLNKVKKYKEKCYSCWDFIFDVIRYVPIEVINKTVIYQIIQKYNISMKYIPFVGVNIDLYKSMPSELDILNDELYDKFKIDNVDINEENFTNYI